MYGRGCSACTCASALLGGCERARDLGLDAGSAVPTRGPRMSPVPLAATTSAWSCATPSAIATSAGASALASRAELERAAVLARTRLELREVQRRVGRDRGGGCPDASTRS